MSGSGALRGRKSQDAGTDQRVRRSRAALTTALTDLVLERGYKSIGIRDVANRAAVGRSTLYTHFCDMNDLLVQSLDKHLATLARCTVTPEMEPELVRVIAHFWHQRSSARTMLQGNAGTAIARFLVRHIEATLPELYRAHPSRSSSPPSLVAEQLAAGQIAVLRMWLSGRAAARPEEVARLLHRTGYAASMASLQPAGTVY